MPTRTYAPATRLASSFAILLTTFFAISIFAGEDPTPLLPNGSFEVTTEEAQDRPAKWDQPDGLGVQWVEAPDGDGKAMRLDTAVSEVDMEKQWRKVGLEQWHIPKAGKGPMAAFYGLSFYSDSMKVTPKQAYRVTFDYLGKSGGAKLWVRGYGVRRGSPLLKADEFADWPGFAHRLRLAAEGAEDAPAGLVFSILDEPQQASVRLHEEEAEVVAKVQEAIVRAINRAIDAKEFGDAKHWPGVKLPGLPADLAEGYAAGTLRRSQRRKVHRRLLEVAFAAELRPSDEKRRRWETIVNCRTKGKGWNRLSQVLHPTRNTPLVTEMRVMLYAYWPPGVYHFDNIRIEPIAPEAYTAGKKEGTQFEVLAGDAHHGE